MTVINGGRNLRQEFSKTGFRPDVNNVLDNSLRLVLEKDTCKIIDAEKNNNNLPMVLQSYHLFFARIRIPYAH